MHRIYVYLGHVALGAVAGIGSAELWLQVLRHTVPLWLTGLVAVAFVLAVEMAAAQVRSRRAGRRPRHRAHARPTTKIRRNIA
jgi:hypothetical protein